MIWFPKTSLAALRCDEPGGISYTFVNSESTLLVHRFNWCKVSLQKPLKHVSNRSQVFPILMIVLPLYDTLPYMNIKRFQEDPAASQYYTPKYRHTHIEFPIKLLGGSACEILIILQTIKVQELQPALVETPNGPAGSSVPWVSHNDLPAASKALALPGIVRRSHENHMIITLGITSESHQNLHKEMFQRAIYSSRS